MYNQKLSDKANLVLHLILFVLGTILAILRPNLLIRIIYAALALYYAVAAVLDIVRSRKANRGE